MHHQYFHIHKYNHTSQMHVNKLLKIGFKIIWTFKNEDQNFPKINTFLRDTYK